LAWAAESLESLTLYAIDQTFQLVEFMPELEHLLFGGDGALKKRAILGF
jgi:hypothetical protein